MHERKPKARRRARSSLRAALLTAAALLANAAEGGAVKVLVEDYESPAELRLGGAAVHPKSKVRLSGAEPFQGKRCAELTYRFTDRKGHQYLEVFTPHRFRTRVRRIALAVRGDGSSQFARVRFTDKSGEYHQFDLGKLDFKGWRVLAADLDGPRGTWGGDRNKKLDYPITFLNIVLDALVRPGEGKVAFDAVTVEAEGMPEDFAEARFEPTQPHGYFWGKDEKPAGTLVVATGIAEPAMAKVEVRLLDHREEVVSQLWKGQVRVRQGKPVRRSLPLKLERYGVYFVEVRVGSHARRHSICWLAEPAPIWDESPFGVCCHFGQHKHTIPLTFELIRRMGAAWIRDEISWGGAERQKGKFTFGDYFDRYMKTAGEMSIHPLIIFDYGNRHYDGGNAPTSAEAVAAFVEYCKALMKRYGEICQHWEIWNEPNIGFWKPKPNVGDYTKLMQAVYPAAKGVNPKATIVGVCTAGTNLPFIEGVLKRGGGKLMDAISVHPYRYPRSPEGSDFLGEMKRLKALLDRYDAGHLKVWLTEFGYPTHVGRRGLPEHRSAAYLVRLSLHALSLPFIERLFIYDFQNDGTNPEYNEHNFGLIRLDNTPKVGYAAFCTMARMLYRKRFARALEAGADVICYEFAGETRKVLAAWPRAQAATLSLTTTAKEVTVTDLMGNERSVAPSDGRITLRLGEEPIFITDYGDVGPARR